jgi:hypothetical protein
MTVKTVSLAVVVCVVSAASAIAQITVGPNVQISKAHDTHALYESYAGAHPTDPQRLIACAVLFLPTRPAQTTAVYLSKDGGKTWRVALQPDDVQRTGDPVCTFGPDGSAYYVALATYQTDSDKHMIIYKSRDGGDTWGQPVHLPLVDREAIAFDSSRGKFHGRVYVNGTGSIARIESGNKNSVFVFRSNNDDLSFQPPVIRLASENQNVVGMGNSVVLSDGTLVTLFGHNKDTTTIEGRENRANQANSWLRVVTSTDGGDTLSTGIIVSDWYMDRERSQGSHIPALAADPGSVAFKDRLYAVWVDSRSGRLDILLSYSADKGKHWSKPVFVNDDRAALDPADGPDAITPVVGVNKDGVVGIAWADRRGHADNLGYDKRFTASLDGGETFLPSVKVSSAPTEFGKNEAWPVTAATRGPADSASGSPARLNVRFSLNSFFTTEGHTSGLAVDAAGVFHPVWIDSRTGIAQVWTAPVAVAGNAIRHGETDLSALDDVTTRVALELTDVSFDRKANMLTATARLKNKSKAPIRGPIKARVIDLRSDLGVPEILDSDNKRTGAGAVWDFTPLIQNQALASDERSAPKMLRFRISDLRPIKQGDALKLGLLDLNVVVLGKADKESPTDERQEPAGYLRDEHSCDRDPVGTYTWRPMPQ